MITLEKTLLSVISGGCDECNQDQTIIETSDNNQNLVENDCVISSSLSQFEPIFSLD